MVTKVNTPARSGGISIAAPVESLAKMVPGAKIHVIDVGPAHKEFINLLRDQVYVSECRRRKVKFLPAQVIRRKVSEVSFKDAQGLSLNPFDATAQHN